jgi:hypothetical protein
MLLPSVFTCVCVQCACVHFHNGMGWEGMRQTGLDRRATCVRSRAEGLETAWSCVNQSLSAATLVLVWPLTQPFLVCRSTPTLRL